MAEPETHPASSASDEIAVSTLIDLLAEPLGLEKAQTVIHDSLQEVGLFGRRQLDRRECRKLLDNVAGEGGLVAIASRLAKIKLISSASKS